MTSGVPGSIPIFSGIGNEHLAVILEGLLTAIGRSGSGGAHQALGFTALILRLLSGAGSKKIRR